MPLNPRVYGQDGLVEVQRPTIIAQRDPTSDDIEFSLGQLWINDLTDVLWAMTSRENGATWTTSSAMSGAAVVDSLEITSGDLDMQEANEALIGRAGNAVNITHVGDYNLNGDINQSSGTSNLNDVVVGGNLTINGDFDISSSDQLSIVSTYNGSDAILVRANGGVNEQLRLLSSQGTTQSSIKVESALGGIYAVATGNTGDDAVKLEAIAGGFTGVFGTIYSLTASKDDNTAFIIEADHATGGGQIKVGSGGLTIAPDGDSTLVDIGNVTPTVSRTVTVSGSVNSTASCDDILNLATGGVSTNADSTKSVNIASGNTATGSQTVNILSGTAASGSQIINIQTNTGGGTKEFNLGNADGLTTNNIRGITSINASVNANVNIGTGTSTGTVTVGNALSTLIDINGALVQINSEGACNYTAATGDLSLIATVGSVIVNGATSATIDSAGLISLDAATSSNFTVSGASEDLTLKSTLGKIILQGGEDAADAVLLEANHANAALLIRAGAQGVIIADEADTLVASIMDIAPTASRELILNNGQNVTASTTDKVSIAGGGVDTNADSIKQVDVAIGSTTVGQTLVNVATGALVSGTLTTSIGSGNVTAGTHTTNISTGTNAGTKTVNIGALDTDVNIKGTLLVNEDTNDNVRINGGTSIGTIELGGGATGNIAIDSGAAFTADSVAASYIKVTGAFDLTLESTGGSVIATSAQAASDAILLDATDAAGGCLIRTAGGPVAISSAGNLQITIPSTTPAAGVATATIDNYMGRVLFNNFTTAAGASEVFTISNSLVTDQSALSVQVSNNEADDAQMTVMRVRPKAGEFEVTVKNNGAAALPAAAEVSLVFTLFVI